MIWYHKFHCKRHFVPSSDNRLVKWRTFKMWHLWNIGVEILVLLSPDMCWRYHKFQCKRHFVPSSDNRLVMWRTFKMWHLWNIGVEILLLLSPEMCWRFNLCDLSQTFVLYQPIALTFPYLQPSTHLDFKSTGCLYHSLHFGVENY